MNNPSKPPMEPKLITAKLREHLNRFEASISVQAIRREHATERSELRITTADLRRWREQAEKGRPR